jgi:Uncharacterized conserved protein
MARAVPIHKLTLPDAPLRASAPVLLVRLQEMREYEQAVRDPARIADLHNMRIAAKRLRYTLEIFAPVLSAEAEDLLKTVEAIQERLGAIHDIDVLADLLEKTLEKETEREKRRLLKKSSGPPEFLAAEGLVALMGRKREERADLYREFLAFYDALPPEEFAQRLARLVRVEDADTDGAEEEEGEATPA